MDLKQVDRLLEKYWEGETSLAEEKELQQFFTYGEVPERLLVYREFFVAREITLNPDLGLDFDQEVLAKIHPDKEQTRWTMIRIAAIGIVLIITAIGLFKLDKSNQQAVVASQQEDTYQSPEEALSETKKAFAMISVAFNKGRQPVGKLAKLDETNNKIKNKKK